ncbi:MAG: hypothetical protein ACM32J_01970 [Rhizobacter sp.]|jgi:hypothetical protein
MCGWFDRVRVSVVCLLAAASTGAWSAGPASGKDTLGLHLFSQHLPAASYNNVNPGIYYRLAEGPVAGIYRNSVRRTSIYGGYTWQYDRFDLTVGAVTGYSQGVQPLLVPSMALFTYRGVTTRLAFIPRVEKRIQSHVLHIVAEL